MEGSKVGLGKATELSGVIEANEGQTRSHLGGSALQLVGKLGFSH